ncbi:TRAP transporter substrate-binding protein, partial [Thioclava sp. BHET1]
TNGQIQVAMMPVGSVVEHNETLDATGAGIIDGIVTDISYFAGKDPAFSLLGNPVGAWSSPSQLLDFMNNGGGQKLANSLFEPYGVHYIGSTTTGLEALVSKVPLDGVADLKGLKIRTPSSKWRVAMFKQWGANPTPMAFSEVFVALQTGTMDGQENPLTNIVGANFQEVQKYLSLSDHVYSPTYLTSGAATWAKLPADVKKAVTEVAAEVQDWSLNEGAQADKALVAKVEAAGVKVNEVDKAAFIKASAPIYAAFNTEVPGGGDLVKQAQDLAQ